MSGPTLEELGRAAVRLVRAVEAIPHRPNAQAEAEDHWAELKALVDQYGARVAPLGGG
jgi:hypothetical protein